MKWNLFKSFRLKIVLYSLLSMLLTFLTMGNIYLIGHMIYNRLNENILPSLLESSDEYFSKIHNGVTSNYIVNNPRNNDVLTSGRIIDRDFLIFLIIFSVILAFILFTIYLWLLTKKYSEYFGHITEGIEKLATGNFDTQIEVKYEDELTIIAKNLNKMSIELKSIIENERNSEYKKNELITNVAHDLRTPLTSIIGYLELVSKQTLSDDIKSKYVTIAYDKSKRLEKLIEDLFSYTKFEFGEIVLYKEEVDIVKLIEQLLEEFYPSFEENQLEFSFKSNEKSATIMADGNLLARAFANLISNAIKYGAAGKNVKLKVKKELKNVSVSIINYGEVIPEEALSYVFDKFYRADYSRNEEKGGSGLGLAIAKNIVEMHRGTISVKSNIEGTEFMVQLPIF